MTYAGLTLTFDGGIARLQLHPGQASHASAEVVCACDEIASRDDISVVLLAAPPGTLDEATAETARALELLPQPVVACVEGAVAGAALEVILACDIRIAGAGASFSMPQIRDGRIPSAGGTQRLPRLAGRAKAAEMILLGVTLDGQEALACGLANAVAADGESLAEGQRMASRIAQQGPLAVRYAKEAVLRGLDMPLEQALRYETDLTVILQTTEDRAEGVQAFLDKRAPRFDGR